MPLYDGGSRAALQATGPRQGRQGPDNAGRQIRNEGRSPNRGGKNTLKTSLSAYRAPHGAGRGGADPFNAALIAYRNGVGSITDVTLAERQLLVAKNAATDAYSTALSAAATLALAAGVLGSAPPG